MCELLIIIKNRLLQVHSFIIFSFFIYLFIVYQVYIVTRCSNTNSHPVISYKIVQRTEAFARKIGSPGRCFAEPSNECTRAGGEASRMGHEHFPGELNIHPSIEFFVSRYETTLNCEIRCYNGGYIKCRYLISGSDAV